MKGIKSIIFAVSILINSSLLLSQTIIYGTDENIMVNEEKTEATDQLPVNLEKSKYSYDIEIGSSFSSSKYYGNMLAFYTMPRIRYKLSPTLNFKAGILLINSNTNLTSFNDNQNRNNYSAYFMSGIEYTKERLRISGEILYGMNNSQYSLYNSKNTPEYFTRFSAEYKITKHLSVGLQIINQNMTQNYNNPFGYQRLNPYQRYNPYSGF